MRVSHLVSFSLRHSVDKLLKVCACLPLFKKKKKKKKKKKNLKIFLAIKMEPPPSIVVTTDSAIESSIDAQGGSNILNEFLVQGDSCSASHFAVRQLSSSHGR
jgi:hypothetical protein